MSGKGLPTWVFVAGTYRSGSTTHYQMTRDIVEETKNGKGIGYHTEAKLEEFDVEGNKPYVVCKVFEFLPNGFKGEPSYGKKLLNEGRMMSVVSVRDPRDIITSMYARDERRGVTFDIDKVAKKDLPVWLANVERWIDFDPKMAYWTKFEEFTRNLLKEIRAIATHLRIELDDQLAKDIAGRYTIKAQGRRKQEYKQSKPDIKEDPWLPSIPSIVFGTSGHYTTWLNAPEQRIVEDAARAFMERFGYLQGGNDETG